ncbi:MAG: tetratricopeptide repeat protein [Flavobacteriales bacterium]|nr:tetratricopeptide repeat protein [Flavobacteriales bacterium]
MMKQLSSRLFPLLLLCLPLAGMAQMDVDSLLGSALKAEPDTNKVKTLLRIGAELTNQGRFEEAREHLADALDLSRSLEHGNGECKALISIGITHFYQGNNREALDAWELAMPIAMERKDEVQQNILRTNMANVHLSTGNYNEAQRAYFEVLKWAEATQRKSNAVDCLMNLGVLYTMQGKLDEAIRYQRRVLDEYGDVLTPFQQVNCLSNLGQLHLDARHVDDAEKAYAELLPLAEQNEQAKGVARAYGGLGNVAMARKDRPGAKEHLQRAADLYAAAGARTDQAILLENLASLYREAVENEDAAFLDRYFQGSASLALSTAHAAIDTAIGIFNDAGDLGQLRSAYRSIAEVERAQGDYKQALSHFQLYQALSDTLLNAERDRKLTETAMQYEFDKKEAATRAEQEQKDLRQRLERNGIAVGLAGALLFLGVVWRQRNRISKEKKRSEELLLNILPEEVAEELKAKGTAEAVHIDQVTVLFTDFKGFTAMSEVVTPQELVRDLNECFSAFDHITEKYGIEKIKTIGDAYMAAGGLPTPNTTHATDVIQAALEMRDLIAEGKARKIAAGLPYFEVRIGIHTGPVVAGIVGVKKFQYDIWGDTVNTASRMESSGEVGQVNISEATYSLVKDVKKVNGEWLIANEGYTHSPTPIHHSPAFVFTPRGKVPAKGKGEMEMYFVRRRSEGA